MSTYAILLVTAVIASATAVYDKHLLEWSFKLTGNSIHWPCAATKSIFTQSGRYTPKNIIATRVQIWRDQALILTPRFKTGVPFTLGKVCLKQKCNPLIQPFPNWELQEEGQPDAIQNAVDFFLDCHDILWVLDVGIVHNLEQPVRRGPPKVVAIDVKTGKVLKTLDLSTLACPSSRLQYIVVEYTDDGKAWVFISDAATRAIVVFDVTAGKGYRVVLPEAVTQDCDRKDVLYIALVKKCDGNNVLYFTYLSCRRMFSINTYDLRQGSSQGTVVDIGNKPAKLVILGTDNGLNIFFRYKGQGDIYMWNTDSTFRESNFITVQEGGDCRLATQVLPGLKKLMWVVESNFQDYIQGKTGCLGASVLLHPLIKNTDE